MDPHAKRAVIMHIASSGLLHYPALFSDGIGLVARSGPPPESRRAHTPLLKTRNWLSLKRKGLKEEIVIKIGLYDLVTSTTLESNKSLGGMWVVSSWKSMVSVRLWRVGLAACPMFHLPVRGHWCG